MLPLLFIYPDINNEIYYFDEFMGASIIISVFILPSMEIFSQSLSSIIKSQYYFTMIKIFMSPILLIFIIITVSVLMSFMFIAAGSPPFRRNNSECL